MSAVLPYLPPISDELAQGRRDIAGVVQAGARNIQAAPTLAGKAGRFVQTVGALVPATAAATANVATAVPRAMAAPVGDFLRGLTGDFTAPPPTAGVPALVAPAAPAVPTVPATHAAVVAPEGGLNVTHNGGVVSISGDAPAPTIVHPSMPVLVHHPIDAGIAQQAAYAEAQRQAVLQAAGEAAAAGNPGNASYRYAAALHALPSLSGTNNFAATQASLAGQEEQSAEQERANIRTTAETRRSTEERAAEVRRQVQVVKIGEQVNPDEKTRMFAPKIDQYGTMSIGDDGKPVIRDMQGNEVGTTASATTGPAVGTKVKEKDGQYTMPGGRTAVVKGGVITEVKGGARGAVTK